MILFSFLGLIITFVLIAWLLYGPITEEFLDFFRMGSVYQGSQVTRSITLTFDDGPDPRYTPRLLALLREHNVKAAFFVLGEKAKAHPDLILDIMADGHILGSHTYQHINSWLVSPWKLKKELLETNRVLQEITGERVLYFRPPWGRMNLFSLTIARSLGMTTILWTQTGRDWQKNLHPEQVSKRLSANICNGNIVLLHDAGGAEGAPESTLEALSWLLPKVHQIGLDVSLETLQLGAANLHTPRFRYTRFSQRIIVPLWLIWERIFDRLYHVYPITRLFRLSVVPWRFGARQVSLKGSLPRANQGRDMMQGGAIEAAAAHSFLSDSPDASGSLGSENTASATAQNLGESVTVTIADGTPMLELHLQNITLQELVHIKSPERMAVYAIKAFRESMYHVALAMKFDDRFQNAQGVFGMTLVNRGLERLGFHLEDIEPTPMNRWVSFLLFFIMVLYHPLGRKRLNQGIRDMRPKLVWMTKEELFDRYYKM